MEAILEREAVSLIRENLAEAVAAHALRETTPGARGWKVSLSTVDGSEYVLRTGLTQDFAQRLALEASGCILTLRTGREYPEDRVELPPCTAWSQGATIELQEGAVAYPGTDGNRPQPAWRPDVAARMDALRSMTLRQLAENKLIPAAAWRRIGAIPAMKVSEVYWRPRTTARCSEVHLVEGADRMTLCGKVIPGGVTHEVHDSRKSRIYTGFLIACDLCTALRKKGARS